MANRVTPEDIIRMNELYHTKYHTYAAVARETGFSASTVSKYIKKDYTPAATIVKTEFHLSDLPDPDYRLLKNTENWGDLCVLSEAETEEIKELWKEISL